MSKVPVKVSRTFNTHTKGDELIVDDSDPEVAALIKGGYFVATGPPEKPAKAPKAKAKGKA